MARLTGLLKFTGSLGNLRSYYDKNSKQYIVATKGGASRELIMNHPAFARTRDNMNEFKALGLWASLFRIALDCISHLHRGYYFSEMVSMAKRIQNMDTSHEKGFRSIESHKAGELLPLIRFNKERDFYRVCTCRFTPRLSLDKRTVTLSIEGLHPYAQIIWPNRYLSFRFTLVALQLADLAWDEAEQAYKPTVMGLEHLSAASVSNWMSWNMDVTDFSMEASFANPALQQPGTMVVVSVGLEVSALSYKQQNDGFSSNGTMGIVGWFV